jgi:hypothetical protein
VAWFEEKYIRSKLQDKKIGLTMRIRNGSARSGPKPLS